MGMLYPLYCVDLSTNEVMLYIVCIIFIFVIDNEITFIYVDWPTVCFRRKH